MSQIRMTPSQMRTHAGEVNNQAQAYADVIQRMRGIINELRGEWEGQASQQFAAQFESLQPSFAAMQRLFEDLSYQLKGTADAVEQMDSQIASKFKV